jgi:hypothetical protein
MAGLSNGVKAWSPASEEEGDSMMSKKWMKVRGKKMRDSFI